MKIYTEFIILNEDIAMPDEEFFCPFMWVEPFDSDGDYYYHVPREKWTTLRIENYTGINHKKRSMLRLYVFRPEENVDYLPSENYDGFMYMRFIEAQKKGGYINKKEVNSIQNPCITIFKFETVDLDDYKKFLLSVYEYLKYTDGFLINKHYKAERFYEEFILDEGE